MCKPRCSKFEQVRKRRAKLQRLRRKKCGLMLDCVSGKGGLLKRLASCPVSWVFGVSVFSPHEL